MTDIAEQAGTPVSEDRSTRDKRFGIVISDKRDKTIRVRHDYMVKHPKYGKYYRRSTTLHAHDEKNEAKVGDLVEVMSCRRISKMKCWRLTQVVRPAAVVTI